MKKRIVVALLISIGSLFLQGCQKESDSIKDDQLVVDETKIESLGQFVPSTDEFFEENKINQIKSGSIILDFVNTAFSYNGIPTYAFRCYDNYKWSYRHVQQPDGHSCSWSSYDICTGNIASVAGKNYPVSVDQICTIRDGCNQSKSILDLRNYANTTDFSYVKARTIGLVKSEVTYLDVIKQMMILLEINKTPFVTIALAGTIPHYVTVYSLYWKQGLFGSKIYFMDSLDPNYGSFDKNIKYMDLSEFLAKMKNNSNTCYNFLELLPR